MLKAIYQKLSTLFSATKINAAQAWQAEGGEAQHAFWLFATPVHLMAGRDSFYMGDTAVEIAHAESKALMESLNQHFAADGYHFYCLDDVWFLGLDDDPKITTAHIDNVKGQDVAPYLPQGEGASVWNKLQTEMQMLLFSHPVNQAREAQGLPMINSLWCYGLGASV